MHTAVEAGSRRRSDGPTLIVIVEAPMGEGKTEAALLIFDALAARGATGLYFALPTQATSNQIFGRVERFLRSTFPGETHGLHLVHGDAGLSDAYGALKDLAFKTRSVGGVAGDDQGPIADAWFARSKRALLAPIAVGTVDQALLGVLGVRHGFLRLHALAGKVVVIDEVHAYDTYTSELLDRLLSWLRALGATVVLLSATLPTARREALVRAFGATPALPESYPRITVAREGPASSRSFATRRDHLPVSIVWQDRATLPARLAEALAGGGCAVWIVNTVRRAQRTYLDLCKLRDRGLLPPGITVDLLHARFPFDARAVRERRAEESFGPGEENRPRAAILIGTQVLEQSLDLDFDLMVTEIAPVDLVLQRAGRLHRHKRKRARPSAVKQPALWIMIPEGDERPEGPVFGSSAYVYSEAILLRSWIALRECTEVTLPTDIEPLIEAVYGGRPAPGGRHRRSPGRPRSRAPQESRAEREASTAGRPLGARDRRPFRRIWPASSTMKIPRSTNPSARRPASATLPSRSSLSSCEAAGRCSPARPRSPSSWTPRIPRRAPSSSLPHGSPSGSAVVTSSLRCSNNPCRARSRRADTSGFTACFPSTAPGAARSPASLSGSILISASSSVPSTIPTRAPGDPRMTQPERPRFDLTRAPWIPCETLDGARVELGFEDVLLRAHELAGIHDESPLATAVIHRLLLAILHRAFDGPRSQAAWEALWAQARFEGGLVRAYFEQWRHRFDLFDAERPFMQVPRLADVLFKERDGKEAEVIPARRLALERSYYAGSTRLLEHGGDDSGLTPADAVRAMLGFQGFGPGGRILNDSGYPKACPLRAGAVALARGETLHGTLVLNLLPPGRNRPESEPDDAPAWEQGRRPRAPNARCSAGSTPSTWQPRRVELLPEVTEGRTLVKSAVTGVGVESDGDWLEPMHALFVRDPKRGAEAVRFDPDRSPWRDATALFQGLGVDDGHRRPAVCAQMAGLVEDDVLKRADLFTIDLYGLASSQAAIGLWRAERMPLPLSLLVDSKRLDVVREALKAAESAEAALRGAVWLLARYALASGDRSPDKKDIGALVDRLDAKPRYWASLGALFDDLLREVGTQQDTEAVLVTWKAAAQRTARRALADVAQQLGTHARALQARALAERHLARASPISRLRPHLCRPQKEPPHDRCDHDPYRSPRRRLHRTAARPRRRRGPRRPRGSSRQPSRPEPDGRRRLPPRRPVLASQRGSGP